MQHAGHMTLHAASTPGDTHNWLDVPAAYDRAALAAQRILEAGRLDGEASKGPSLESIKISMAVVAANRVVSMIKGGGMSPSDKAEGAQIRELLGTSAARFKG
jgi:hypothetical protein